MTDILFLVAHIFPKDLVYVGIPCVAIVEESTEAGVWLW